MNMNFSLDVPRHGCNNNHAPTLAATKINTQITLRIAADPVFYFLQLRRISKMTSSECIYFLKLYSMILELTFRFLVSN